MNDTIWEVLKCVELTYLALPHPSPLSITHTTHPPVDQSPQPSSFPSSSPSSQPTSQPSSQPSKRPPTKLPTGQPTSRPTVIFRPAVAAANRIGGLSVQTAIIIFVCVGVIVLFLFVCFTYYCQNQFVNKEEDRVHSLEEENFERDDMLLEDQEGNVV